MTVIITMFGLMVMVIRQRCERRSCSVPPSLSSDPEWFSFCGGRRGRGLLRDQGRLQLERWLLFPVDGGNVCACLHFMDIIVFVITVVVITVRLSRQVLVVRLLMFVLFVMCIIMIMCVLHMSIIMSMIVVVIMFVVMTCRCTSSWTGSSSLLGAPCGLLFCVCMVGVGLVVWMTMAMPVTMAMAFLSG